MSGDKQYLTNLSKPNNSSSLECGVDGITVSFQLLIVIINSIHLIILKKLKQSNKSTALHIIILMCIDDIAYSLFNLASSEFCLQPESIHHCLRGFMKCLWSATATMKYCILATACYDRYVAICHPFRYSSNYFLSHTTGGLLVMFVLKLVTETPLFITLLNPGCATQLGDQQSDVIKIITTHYAINEGIWNGSCAIIILTTVTLVLRELYKMRRGGERAPHTPDASVLKVTRLILVTVAVFVCCLLLPICTEAYFLQRGESRSKQARRVRMLFDSYAVINVLVFGAMNKDYRSEIKRGLRSCLPILAISPDGNHPTSNNSVAPADNPQT